MTITLMKQLPGIILMIEVYEFIDSDDDYETDGGDEMLRINQTLYGPSQTITEQEQLNLFPTGQFNFPVGSIG